MSGWTILIVAAVVAAQPAPPKNVGTLTTDDPNITCAGVQAFMEKMAKDSHRKIKPIKCYDRYHGGPATPKKSN